jgi:hypothetical protein
MAVILHQAPGPKIILKATKGPGAGPYGYSCDYLYGATGPVSGDVVGLMTGAPSTDTI